CDVSTLALTVIVESTAPAGTSKVTPGASVNVPPSGVISALVGKGSGSSPTEGLVPLGPEVTQATRRAGRKVAGRIGPPVRVCACRCPVGPRIFTEFGQRRRYDTR